MTVQTKRPWWLWAKPADALVNLMLTAFPIVIVLTREKPRDLLDLLIVGVFTVLVVLALVNLVAFKRHPEWITDRNQRLTEPQMRWYGTFVGVTAAVGVAILVYSFATADASLVFAALVLFAISILVGTRVRRRHPHTS